MTTYRSLLSMFALLLVFATVMLPATPVAAVSRGTIVTTTLKYGVTCTTTTLVVDLGVVPRNSNTFHKVECNVAVGRIHVNAAQSNETNDAYYGSTATCYNTTSCSVYIGDKPYVEGNWLIDTAGIVGTTANPSYYGFTQNAGKWVYCYSPACSF